ncbi:MAG TPA: hypothetical protein VGJ84_03550, partial [Polyangiaceae bacterium]
SREMPKPVSRDRGAHWVRAAGLPKPSPSPDWAPVSMKPASDRVNPKKFYVYDLMSGKNYSSNDGGATFSEIASSLEKLPDYQLLLGSIQAVPGFEGDVWLSTGKRLQRSTDSGKKYDAMDSVDESYGIGFGKPPPGATFPALFLSGKVQGVIGFFRSDDAGKTWIRINDDAHQFGSVSVITGDPRVFGRVYIGTGGRGILYGDALK